MPEKITVEMIVAKPGRREGEGGKDLSAPPATSEVQGHGHHYMTYVICPHCGSHRVIEAERHHTLWYTCGNCGMDYYY